MFFSRTFRRRSVERSPSPFPSRTPTGTKREKKRFNYKRSFFETSTPHAAPAKITVDREMYVLFISVAGTAFIAKVKTSIYSSFCLCVIKDNFERERERQYESNHLMRKARGVSQGEEKN
jgi:hypothetical protein